MTKSKPTAETVRSLLSYDPDTGLLAWLPRPTVGLTGGLSRGVATFNKYQATLGVGNLDGAGGLTVKVLGNTYPVHHLAWLIAYGEWPRGHLRHINHHRTDNRLCNLSMRKGAWDATMAFPTATPGVFRYRGKFSVVVDSGRHKRYLGSFDTPEAVHQAYRVAILANGFDPTHNLPAHIRYALS